MVPNLPSRSPLAPSTSDKRNAAAVAPTPRLRASSSSSSPSSKQHHSDSVDRTRPSRALTATTRSLSVSFQGEPFLLRTPKPPSPTQPRTLRRLEKPNLLARSLDFTSSQTKEPVLAAVRLLQQSMVSNDNGPRPRATPRGIIVPARFLTSSPRAVGGPKMVTPKKPLVVDGQLKCTRETAVRGQLWGRSTTLASNASLIAGRVRKGESWIEDAHTLRMLNNQYLQWRFVNARASAAFSAQSITAEKDLHSAWISTSKLCDSVTAKRTKLIVLTQNLKVTPILDQQMAYLEEWSHMERDHINSLSGANEALKASTLRLPVVGGAKVLVQEVKVAVASAIAVMQAITTSKRSPVAQVERTSSLMSELAEIAEQERALLEQSRDLLSTVEALHVRQCSFHGHILQMNHKPSLMQL